MSVKGGHVPALDGIRGLAVLYVMLHHMTLLTPTNPVEHVLSASMFSGWIGVDLFFVLSGALITGILLDTKGSPAYFQNFYIRRVLRIFPLYFAVLIFSFYVLPHFPIPKLANLNRVHGDEIWYWLFLSNYSIAAVNDYRHGIMDVTWTLAIEEQFYLVWPMVVYFLNRKQLVVTSIALIVFSLTLRFILLALDVGRHEGGQVYRVALYVLTPTRLDGLCAGALIALAVRSDIPTQFLRKLWPILVAAGGALTGGYMIFSGGLAENDPVVQSVGYTVFAVLFAGVVLGGLTESGSGSWFDRILGARVLAMFGLFSYALYLFHMPLRAMLRDVVLKPANFHLYPGGEIVGQLVFYVAGISLSLALAALSYYCYERPFLRLKKYVTPFTRFRLGRPKASP